MNHEERSSHSLRNAPEARYTNQHCRPLHQYKRAKGENGGGGGGERAKETAMYDLVSRMLDYDPTFRITLKEALRHDYFGCYADNTDKENAAPPLLHSQNGETEVERARRHILRLQI